MALFRIIDVVEFDDSQRTGVLRCVEGMNEGKWFFEGIENAPAWRQILQQLLQTERFSSK